MTWFFVAAALAGPLPLDGRTFEVSFVEPGKKPEKDTLIFADGTFRSTACDPYGFTATAYTVAPIEGGDAYSFVVDAKSPKEGLAHWVGTVDGDRVIGLMTWTKAGQKPIVYTFAGSAVSRPTGTR
ncbi:MAG: hypothetical protein ACOZNI_31040 [Myxococcota bacterium]